MMRFQRGRRKGGCLSVLCLVLILCFHCSVEGKWRQDWEEEEGDDFDEDISEPPVDKEKSPEARFQELREWVEKGNKEGGGGGDDEGLPPLSVDQYLNLIRPSPRNFSVLLLLQPKVDERKGRKPCPSCETALWYWNHFGSAHNSHFQAGEKEPLLLFFVVTFSKKDVKRIKLPITLKQPNIYFLEASVSGQRWSRIQRFQVSEVLEDESGFRLREKIDDRDLTKWIKEVSPVKTNFTRKVPPKKHVKGLGFVIGVGLYMAVRLIGFRTLVNFLFRCWRSIRLTDYEHMIIVFILFCISGQFYNFIRNTPFAYVPASGGVLLVSRGNYQFGIESYFIMIIYGVMVLSMIQFTRNVDQSLKVIRTNQEYLRWAMAFAIALWALMYMNLMKR